MTVTEILLNAKNTPLSSIVRQTEIQTEEDKASFCNKGYMIELTEAEFREKFPELSPANIAYTPSMSCMTLYFNPETMAVCPLHLQMLLMPSGEKYLENISRIIQQHEADAANGIFTSAIKTLPDRMRLDFFVLLAQKFGSNVKDLYKQFFDAYTASDFGFRGFDRNALDVILQSKTDEDRTLTANNLSHLPEIVTIYRGCNTLSAEMEGPCSWSLDVNVANFFAARLGNGPAYILKATIRKEDIIEAFLGDRGNGEKEIIADPKDIRVERKYTLSGINYLKTAIPRVAPIYQEYKEKLRSLQFTCPSEGHGALHELRVLLLAQFIAEDLGLSKKDREILAMAAIYHDTRRTHDWDDEAHGKAAGEHYWENERKHNPVVRFLCEYHCLPDEEGYREIRTSSVLGSYGKEKVELLFRIFKDADALDRVRFGIRELDWNYLRLEPSRCLSLVARINVDQIRN